MIERRTEIGPSREPERSPKEAQLQTLHSLASMGAASDIDRANFPDVSEHLFREFKIGSMIIHRDRLDWFLTQTDNPTTRAQVLKTANGVQQTIERLLADSFGGVEVTEEEIKASQDALEAAKKKKDEERGNPLHSTGQYL